MDRFTALVMLLPHHLVIRVDEVTAGVVEPARPQWGPVFHPAIGVVHAHLVPGPAAPPSGLQYPPSEYCKLT